MRSAPSLWQQLAVALAYVICGRLALLLAIPPGYATAVWPAAGCAVAAVLLLGRGVWPGILFGSFLVNVWTSIDLSDAASVATSVAVAAGIAAGAALQAVCAERLCRPFLVDLALTRDRETWALLLLGGPVASLLSATGGVAVLWSAGLLPGGEVAFHWFTWWVGDSIGVLVFAPLILLWAGRPCDLRRAIGVSLPVAGAFTLVVVLFVYASAWELSRIRREFEARAATLAGKLQHQCDLWVEVLLDVVNFYAASNAVDREEFRTFVTPILSRHPEILALESVVLVRDGDRAEWESRTQENEPGGTPIMERDAAGEPAPARKRAEYLPVAYSEPASYRPMIGFDMAGEAKRRALLETARDHGQPAATDHLPLLRLPEHPEGILLAAPLYRNGAPRSSLTERRANIVGWAIAVVHVVSMVDTVAELPDSPVIQIYLRSAAEENEAEWFYRNLPDAPRPQRRVQALVEMNRTLRLADREYRVRFRPADVAGATGRSWEAWLVLAFGQTMTGLFGALLVSGTGRTRRIESIVDERTREIIRLNEMADLLHTCVSSDEAGAIVGGTAGRLFPEHSGALFLLRPSRNLLEVAGTWGAPGPSRPEPFAPEDCWGLRRGQPHLYDGGEGGLRCRHRADSAEACSLCLPLIAQGDVLGVMTLAGGKVSDERQRLAHMISQSAALAIGALRTRERLREQSIRDPLTGLFNRRYLDESLPREVSRCARNGSTLGVLMIDVDHFKRFNDTHGHEAGDCVLRGLGDLVLHRVRGGDLACRYGGEELALVLTEATASDVRRRAEGLREEVKRLQVTHRDQLLTGITISVGVSYYPASSSTADGLLRAADAALYRAKAAGRDRVETAE